MTVTDHGAAASPNGISARRLTLRSAFLFGYAAIAMLTVPFGLLMGLIALGGGSGVYLNGAAVHGIAGLATSLAIGIVAPLPPALALTLGTLLLRLLPRTPELRVRDGR